MKYFLDTEFLEDFHKPLFGRRRHFIDLITIGMVAEDGRTYYAISREFDVKKAWNKWQPRTGEGDRNNAEPRHYWLRENVLLPLWKELEYREYREEPNEWKQEFYKVLDGLPEDKRVDVYIENMLPASYINYFTVPRLTQLIKKYGKPIRQIVIEICDFIDQRYLDINDKSRGFLYPGSSEHYPGRVFTRDLEFYGYFCDYDWVVFCSLFGTMDKLPNGFPYYCHDLKQMLDEKAGAIDEVKYKQLVIDANYRRQTGSPVISFVNVYDYSFAAKLLILELQDNYPAQTNEHNALSDALWNKNLYEFLLTLG